MGRRHCLWGGRCTWNQTLHPGLQRMLRSPRLQVRSSGGGAGDGGTAGGMQGRGRRGGPSIQKQPSVWERRPGGSKQEGFASRE